MPQTRSLTKPQALSVDLILNGWIPLQVNQVSPRIFKVSSASTIGHYHTVKLNPILGLTCTHEYTEHNDYNSCNHIKAVQSLTLSNEEFLSFDQEIHTHCAQNGLQATKTKKQWEWLINDSRGAAIGCLGVKVTAGKAQWWATYEGNHNATWDYCLQAIEYLIAIVSF